MFAPYCDVHGSRVLLSTESIEAVTAGEEGIEVWFRCHCGAVGVWRTKEAPAGAPATTVPSRPGPLVAEPAPR